MAILYVVGTPLGNLGDMSARGLETLRHCALIAAEDTRVTRKLLTSFDIHTPCLSYHAHNEENRAAQLVRRMLAEDIDVALVSDAGMPTISDPGAVLVREALDAGIAVTSVPGPSAVSTALSLTGWEIDDYGFFGFLPRAAQPLRKKLREIAASGLSFAVVYESPFRVVALVQAIVEALSGAALCVCCDLTKKFELVVRGEAPRVLEALQANPNTQKGEYCVVVNLRGVDAGIRRLEAGAEGEQGVEWSLEAQLVQRMVVGDTLSEAKAALQAAGARRNALYQAAMQLEALFLEEE